MKNLSYLLVLLAFAACNQNTPETEVPASTPKAVEITENRDTLLKHILENNEAISSTYDMDSVIFICRGQAQLCEEFVTKNPTDIATPKVLSFQAKAYKGLHETQKAIDTYDKLIQGYPTDSSLPEAMLVKAIMLDQELQDKAKAEKAYLSLIQKFPNHPFAKDAQALLTQVHMSDEELIRSFEAKNKKK